jgi:fructokinase
MGTGLIALDIVVSDRPGVGPRCWAGGTCGNVLAVLAYLGWRAYPAATLGEDVAGDHVLADLKKFDVSARFLGRSASRHTPVIVEKIRTRPSGIPTHRFEWHCPNCGAWLPGYQALVVAEAREVAKVAPSPTVFFFDRVSRGALDLARACKEKGALIVFEPSGIRDERQFNEAVALSHVVKYSNQRVGRLREALGDTVPLLEIETVGGDGLRYRRRDVHQGRSHWREMGAYSVPEIRDTAGAGDWCSAGLIHGLLRKGGSLAKATQEDLEGALRLGQALAAVKCGYEGARGPMYGLTKPQFQAAVARVLEGETPTSAEAEADSENQLAALLGTICPSCDERSGHHTTRRASGAG